MNPLTRIPRVAYPARRVFLFLTYLILAVAPVLQADTITGTIKDPSGAVVSNARIQITGENASQPAILLSDEHGKFASSNLVSGKYSVRVIKDGFEELVTDVELHGTADLDLKLALATQQTSVTVTGKSAALANSDPVYRQLRDIELGDT